MFDKTKQLKSFFLFRSLNSYSEFELMRVKFNAEAAKALYMSEIKKYGVDYSDKEIGEFIDNHLRESLIFNSVH